ncbi:putative HicB family RNase H-like nuclease [Streptomyces rishiriensis]|uniref:HicB family RNase H-like nuclease n=1 Tax=Streptomyces rishiriensis TaxID=68264 RepID=A0ABU0NH97_STRRH|nr:putative HicB family RNase H-like nuclease [Streptomyces rishiriensis]
MADTGTYPCPWRDGKEHDDVRCNVRIPEEAKDQLAAIAAAEGLSLRAYLARFAE